MMRWLVNSMSCASIAIRSVRLAVSTRMMAYATSVAKPSSSGLKLDLDRFRQDAEQLIRGMKKEADAFIAHAKEAIAATEPEDDET